MVFHTMVMQLPQSLRVVGGTGLLLGIAALPVVLKSKCFLTPPALVRPSILPCILPRAADLPSSHQRDDDDSLLSRTPDCYEKPDQSGGRGMEAFSSEKPEMVEKLQDQQKKERYLGGDQKR